MKRVLLGQLSANGDCFYTTTLARQVKHDHPDCHLTWAVSRQCRDVLRNNPHVDAVWEWDVPDAAAQRMAWDTLEQTVLRVQQGPDAFDKVCLSQIWPNNFRHYDGTVRPSILRAYGGALTVPVDSTIVLTEEERAQVEDFAATTAGGAHDYRVLVECAASSGQSFVTPAFALAVAEKVGEVLPGCLFILSTHRRLETNARNVVWADALNMRQNAALTHHCDMFVGCGSGLTVVATSEAAKPLPNIQILTARTSVYASFCHDFEYFGKPSDRFIEMGDPDVASVADAVVAELTQGHDAARARHHRPLPVSFEFYGSLIDSFLIKRGWFCDALQSVLTTAERYDGFVGLLQFAEAILLPRLTEDPAWWNPRRRAEIEPMVAAVQDGLARARGQR